MKFLTRNPKFKNLAWYLCTNRQVHSFYFKDIKRSKKILSVFQAFKVSLIDNCLVCRLSWRNADSFYFKKEFSVNVLIYNFFPIFTKPSFVNLFP